MGRPGALIIRPRNVLKAALLIVAAIAAIAYAWEIFAAPTRPFLEKCIAVFGLVFFVALPVAFWPRLMERQWTMMLSDEGITVNPYRGDQPTIPWRDIEGFEIINVSEGSPILKIQLAASATPRKCDLSFCDLDLDRSATTTKKLLEEWRARAMQSA